MFWCAIEHESFKIFAHKKFIVLYLQYGSLSAGPFGPVLDGVDGLLPKTPAELRQENNVMKVNILAGVTKDEGAYLAGGSI